MKRCIICGKVYVDNGLCINCKMRKIMDMEKLREEKTLKAQTKVISNE